MDDSMHLYRDGCRRSGERPVLPSSRSGRALHRLPASPVIDARVRFALCPVLRKRYADRDIRREELRRRRDRHGP